MTPQAFHDTYRPYADRVSAGTNIDPIVLLAQWARETGWGDQIYNQCNLGNIRCLQSVPCARGFAQFPSFDSFVGNCIAVFHNGLYDAVMAASNTDDQLAALCASQWDGNDHYGGNLHPQFDPLEGFELNKDQVYVAVDTQNRVANTVQPALVRIEKAVAAISSPPPATVDLKPVLDALTALKAELDVIRGALIPIDLTPLAQAIANVQVITTTIEAQLKAGLRAT